MEYMLMYWSQADVLISVAIWKKKKKKCVKVSSENKEIPFFQKGVAYNKITQNLPKLIFYRYAQKFGERREEEEGKGKGERKKGKGEKAKGKGKRINKNKGKGKGKRQIKDQCCLLQNIVEEIM